MKSAFIKQAQPCLLAAAYLFFTLMNLSFFNTAQLDISKTFQWMNKYYEIIAPAYLYALVIALLPAGLLLDRFSTKLIILVMFVFLISANFVWATAPSFPSALGCRIIAGIANVVAFLAALKTARLNFPKQQALASSTVISIGMCGGVIGGAPLAILLQMISWQQVLLYYSVCGLLIWLLILFFFQRICNTPRCLSLTQHLLESAQESGF